jgi:hypothetical protein
LSCTGRAQRGRRPALASAIPPLCRAEKTSSEFGRHRPGNRLPHPLSGRPIAGARRCSLPTLETGGCLVHSVAHPAVSFAHGLRCTGGGDRCALTFYAATVIRLYERSSWAVRLSPSHSLLPSTLRRPPSQRSGGPVATPSSPNADLANCGWRLPSPSQRDAAALSQTCLFAAQSGILWGTGKLTPSMPMIAAPRGPSRRGCWSDDREPNHASYRGTDSSRRARRSREN